MAFSRDRYLALPIERNFKLPSLRSVDVQRFFYSSTCIALGRLGLCYALRFTRVGVEWWGWLGVRNLLCRCGDAPHLFWLGLIWPGVSLILAFPLSVLFPSLFVQRYQAAQASSLEGLVAETF